MKFIKSEIIRKIYDENLLEFIDDIEISERNKEIILLYIKDTYTYKDLSRIYGIAENTIQQIVMEYAIVTHHLYVKKYLLKV